MSIHYEELEYTQSELDERCEMAVEKALAQFRWLSTDEVPPDEDCQWLIKQPGWLPVLVGPCTGREVVELYNAEGTLFFPVSRIAGGGR